LKNKWPGWRLWEPPTNWSNVRTYITSRIVARSLASRIDAEIMMLLQSSHNSMAKKYLRCFHSSSCCNTWCVLYSVYLFVIDGTTFGVLLLLAAVSCLCVCGCFYGKMTIPAGRSVLLSSRPSLDWILHLAYCCSLSFTSTPLFSIYCQHEPACHCSSQFSWLAASIEKFSRPFEMFLDQRRTLII
jgi:transposase InsO family protein